jgi:hypothetical protein
VIGGLHHSPIINKDNSTIMFAENSIMLNQLLDSVDGFSTLRGNPDSANSTNIMPPRPNATSRGFTPPPPPGQLYEPKFQVNSVYKLNAPGQTFQPPAVPPTNAKTLPIKIASPPFPPGSNQTQSGVKINSSVASKRSSHQKLENKIKENDVEKNSRLFSDPHTQVSPNHTEVGNESLLHLEEKDDCMDGETEYQTTRLRHGLNGVDGDTCIQLREFCKNDNPTTLTPGMGISNINGTRNGVGI